MIQRNALPLPSQGTRLRASGSRIAASGLLLLGALATHAAVTAKKSDKAPASKPAVTQLAYEFKPGSTHRYSVTAILNGHIPPFSHPGEPPIHVRARFTYIANVKKVDDKGAQVEFTVDSADLGFLEKDPGPNGKIPPDAELVWPISLPEVQQRLNVTATLRPDGSVASVEGGSGMPIQIDVGFDLRKLFLLMLPVTFPDKPVRINDTWTFTDGLLGNKPGKVSYTGRLVNIAPIARSLQFRVHQDAQAMIDDRHDKAGKLTTSDIDAVDSTTGKVTVTGDLLFVASAPSGQMPAAAVANTPDRHLGRLSSGHLVLDALLTRKRTTPDADHPEEPLSSQIDVQARLFVRSDDKPQKPQGTATPAKTAGLAAVPNHASKVKEDTQR